MTRAPNRGAPTGAPPRHVTGRRTAAARKRYAISERDVVFSRRAAARAHGLRREVRRIGRDVRVRGEAVAAAARRRALFAPAEELDGVGDDLDRLALLALLRL